MPIFGLGLHFLVALYFAVHVIRTGQQMYWLIILFSFPLLGSLVYFLAIYLPNSRLEHGARRVVASAVKSLDPTRELREARAAYDYTPTAQNQMRLASALLEAGVSDEAARTYEACLQGPFASNPDIRLDTARACFACNRLEDAIAYLESIRQSNANFQPDRVAVLLARAYAGLGRSNEARAEFEFAVDRFGTFDARAEYAIWAFSVGDTTRAHQLHAELNQTIKHWDRHNRELNQAMTRRLEEAFSKAG